MAWTWRYERTDASPVELEGSEAPSFSSQSDAETWIGEEWEMLLRAGVDAVTLLEEEREVYGPMSLHPPAE
jgi:hypothetical protein